VRRVAFAAGAAGVAALAVLHVLYYFPRAVDDMYIFLRYAENLARGEGFAYNPGEHVEGFSSPLWVLLLAAGELLGLGGVTFSKFLAVVSFAALLLGLYRLGRERLDLSRPAALLACAFAALDSYLVSWSMYGLETPAYLALMVWSAVLLGRHVDAPALRRGVAFAATATAFSLSRPEAPLFLAVIGLAVVAEPLRPRAMLDRLRAAALPALAVAAAFGAWLLFRRAYFGLWLPNTYYAKLGGGFRWAHLRPLVAQGATPFEVVLAIGGLALALWPGIVRRGFLVLAVCLTAAYSTATVFLDWMPNLRHLLPLWVFVPLAWAFAAERIARLRLPLLPGRWSRVPGGVLAALAAALVLSAGVAVARVDSRYSPMDFATHGGSRNWTLRKSAGKWHDAWLCLTRRVPSHVRAMDPFDMGMITQLYRLLEADTRPLEETWYVGRDIGRVGYLAPVLVFDTDGLFTLDVTMDPDWHRDRRVTRELARRALERPVVMTELLGEWVTSARSDPWIRGRYRPLEGNDWGLLLPLAGHPPTAAQIVTRYERAATKMPQWFYAMTLYGEAVGAAIERRLSIVRQIVRDNPEPTVPRVLDRLEGGVASLERVAELLGCSVTPAVVAPGEDVLVTCYYHVLQGTRRRYRVFLHLEGQDVPLRFLGDHWPVGGLYGTDRWRPGEIVRDAARVVVPGDARPGMVRVFLGLFEEGQRLHAEPAALLDGAGRVRGPTFRIREK
jgi:hypothetical protein